jgi:hypothetical protein
MFRAVLVAALAAYPSVCGAFANSTRDSGDGRIVIWADVADAKLDRDRSAAQLQISYGTSTTGAVHRTWANGIVINCSNGVNTVFANGAGDFSFPLGNVDKSLGSRVSLFTESRDVAQMDGRGIIAHANAFNVWAGVDREGLTEVLEGLANGESIYFKIDEPASGVKTVSVALNNYTGFSNFSAFRKACDKIWGVNE